MNRSKSRKGKPKSSAKDKVKIESSSGAKHGEANADASMNGVSSVISHGKSSHQPKCTSNKD